MMDRLNRPTNKYCPRCDKTVRWVPVSLPTENVLEPIQFACLGGNSAPLCGLREARRDDA